MKQIVINPDKMKNIKGPKGMVIAGHCEVCGDPIQIANAVEKILKKLDREVKTCSRACADKKLGIASGEGER